MKRTIKKIRTIVAVTIMCISAYLLGTVQTIQAQPMEIIIPDGYIKLDECIPLEDISCWYMGGYDYPVFELKDISNQLDNKNNRSYADIMNTLSDETEDFTNNFVDMRQVADFVVNGDSLQLYMSDGSGYYWER